MIKQRGLYNNVLVVSASGLNELNDKIRGWVHSTRHQNERRGIVPSPATTASQRSRSNVVNNNSPPVEAAAAPLPPLPAASLEATPRTAEVGRGFYYRVSQVLLPLLWHVSHHNVVVIRLPMIPYQLLLLNQRIYDAIEGVGGVFVVILHLSDHTDRSFSFLPVPHMLGGQPGKTTWSLMIRKRCWMQTF